mmetsp:Transcript_3087/g.5913  ORF Transcript_3087/g.5913 Transcript_3087/m.5913 type:complete len:190 (-) Transcript_3087:317-886(-)
MFSIFSCGRGRERPKQRKKQAKVVKRVSESEFLRAYRAVELFPENGAETLKTSLPKRGDFCGAIMDKVYFEHCLNQIRKPHVKSLSNIDILLKKYDANYRARRVLAEKLLQLNVQPEETYTWAEDDKGCKHVPSIRNPKRGGECSFYVHSRSMRRQTGKQRAYDSKWVSETKPRRPVIANSVYKFTKAD